ncbi:MAG: carbamate kinase [Lachnospiraceae bacterium]|nr:carbamate kinase [Lachnospiraceae bacterium]
MEQKLAVVAIGRNYFGSKIPEQKLAVKEAAMAIADLVQAKYQVVITHSNSVQIGMIHAAMNEFAVHHPEFTPAPMSVCNAMSQGYIGYDLQNEIRTELLTRGVFKTVTTLITQTKVDPFDNAFQTPVKPIGRVMSKEEAEKEVQKGNHVTGSDEEGYRRIVSSPKPVEIYELDAIKALLAAGQIVVAAGGGGIPVLEQGVRLKGASAVIEKDEAAEKLALDLGADTLIFLTAADKMVINEGKEGEKVLTNLSSDEAFKILEQENLERHSSHPKLFAAADFASKGEGRRSVITSAEFLKAALAGRAGTVITEGGSTAC